MDQNQALRSLIQHYKSQGRSEEEIVKMCDELVQEATEQFLIMAEGVFTDEDIAAMNAITDDTKVEEEALRRYKLRTDKDPEEEMQGILARLAASKMHPEEPLKQ